jgi:two-component system, cell cycle response regulator
VAARILVIEDNPANLELMTYLLNAFGYATLVARDGKEGLETAQRERPDLIVCDIQLPGMNGYEVARALKADPAIGAIPLVAVTAFAMVDDRKKTLAAGFDGYLSKPIAPETFVAQVQAFLRPELRASAVTRAVADARPASPPPPRRRSVLVTDDRAVNLELAASILGAPGYEVLTARTLRDALRLALERRPDLIVSDVCMAEGSGYEFIRAVKADRRLSAIPFVFITATMTTESERQKGLALGAVKYLFRPIEPQELLREIESCFADARRG